MLSSITMLVTYVVLGLPAGAIGIPWALLTGDIGPLYRWSLWIVRTGVRLARIHVQVVGRELIPERPCIFMANHVSNLDPPALLPCIPGRTSAFVKRSLMKIPGLGWGMKLGDFVPVDRDGRVEGAMESIRAARLVLRKGLHITTFVEGTRSLDGRMLPFKKGPFYLATETGAPCVPVSIYGTETMMAKGSLRIRPATAHITFHPPLDPANFASREELLQAVRSSIASGLPEWMRD